MDSFVTKQPKVIQLVVATLVALMQVTVNVNFVLHPLKVLLCHSLFQMVQQEEIFLFGSLPLLVKCGKMELNLGKEDLMVHIGFVEKGVPMVTWGMVRILLFRFVNAPSSSTTTTSIRVTTLEKRDKSGKQTYCNRRGKIFLYAMPHVCSCDLWN